MANTSPISVGAVAPEVHLPGPIRRLVPSVLSIRSDIEGSAEQAAVAEFGSVRESPLPDRRRRCHGPGPWLLRRPLTLMYSVDRSDGQPAPGRTPGTGCFRSAPDRVELGEIGAALFKATGNGAIPRATIGLVQLRAGQIVASTYLASCTPATCAPPPDERVCNGEPGRISSGLAVVISPGAHG